jgi:hypothetical protein
MTAFHVISTHWILVSIIIFFARYLARRYLSPLRGVPGPILASVTRAWKGGQYSSDKHSPSNDANHMRDKYTMEFEETCISNSRKFIGNMVCCTFYLPFTSNKK